jgi:hypothetical protein
MFDLMQQCCVLEQPRGMQSRPHSPMVRPSLRQQLDEVDKNAGMKYCRNPVGVQIRFEKKSHW